MLRQVLGFVQVHFPREAAVIFACFATIVPAIYQVHGLGTKATLHEILLLVGASGEVANTRYVDRYLGVRID
jgi:hypothetical protein